MNNDPHPHESHSADPPPQTPPLKSEAALHKLVVNGSIYDEHDMIIPHPDQQCGVRSWIHYEEMKADGFDPENITQCQEWERLNARRKSEEAHKSAVDELDEIWKTAKKETEPDKIIKVYLDFRQGSWAHFSEQELQRFHRLRLDILAHIDNCGTSPQRIINFLRGYEQSAFLNRGPGELLNLACQISDSVEERIAVAKEFERLNDHDPFMFPSHCIVLHATERIAKSPDEFHSLERAWRDVCPATVRTWSREMIGKPFDATKEIQKRIRACRKKAQEPAITLHDALAAAESAAVGPGNGQTDEQLRIAYGKAVVIPSTAEEWQLVAGSIEPYAKRAWTDTNNIGFDAEEWAQEFSSAGSKSDSVDYLRGREPLYKTTEKSLLLARRYASVTGPLQPEHVCRCWSRAWRNRIGTIDRVRLAIAATQATWLARTQKKRLGKLFIREAINTARSGDDWHAIASACMFFGKHLPITTSGPNPTNPLLNTDIERKADP